MLPEGCGEDRHRDAAPLMSFAAHKLAKYSDNLGLAL